MSALLKGWNSMLQINVQDYRDIRALCKCIGLLYDRADEETKQLVQKQFKNMISQEEQTHAITRR